MQRTTIQVWILLILFVALVHCSPNNDGSITKVFYRNGRRYTVRRRAIRRKMSVDKTVYIKMLIARVAKMRKHRDLWHNKMQNLKFRYQYLQGLFRAGRLKTARQLNYYQQVYSQYVQAQQNWNNYSTRYNFLNDQLNKIMGKIKKIRRYNRRVRRIRVRKRRNIKKLQTCMEMLAQQDKQFKGKMNAEQTKKYMELKNRCKHVANKVDRLNEEEDKTKRKAQRLISNRKLSANMRRARRIIRRKLRRLKKKRMKLEKVEKKLKKLRKIKNPSTEQLKQKDEAEKEQTKLDEAMRKIEERTERALQNIDKKLEDDERKEALKLVEERKKMRQRHRIARMKYGTFNEAMTKNKNPSQEKELATMRADIRGMEHELNTNDHQLMPYYALGFEEDTDEILDEIKEAEQDQARTMSLLGQVETDLKTPLKAEELNLRKRQKRKLLKQLKKIRRRKRRLVKKLWPPDEHSKMQRLERRNRLARARLDKINREIKKWDRKPTLTKAEAIQLKEAKNEQMSLKTELKNVMKESETLILKNIARRKRKLEKLSKNADPKVKQAEEKIKELDKNYWEAKEKLGKLEAKLRISKATIADKRNLNDYEEELKQVEKELDKEKDNLGVLLGGGPVSKGAKAVRNLRHLHKRILHRRGIAKELHGKLREASIKLVKLKPGGIEHKNLAEKIKKMKEDLHDENRRLSDYEKSKGDILKKAGIRLSPKIQEKIEVLNDELKKLEKDREEMEEKEKKIHSQLAHSTKPTIEQKQAVNDMKERVDKIEMKQEELEEEADSLYKDEVDEQVAQMEAKQNKNSAREPVKITAAESEKVDALKEKEFDIMPRDQLDHYYWYVDEEIAGMNKELDALERKKNPTEDEKMRKLSLRKKLKKRKRLRRILAKRTGHKPPQDDDDTEPIIAVKVTPEESEKVDAMTENDINTLPKEKLDDLYNYVDQEIGELANNLNNLEKKPNPTSEDEANKINLRRRLTKRRRLRRMLAGKTGRKPNKDDELGLVEPVKVTPQESAEVDLIKEADLDIIPKTKLNHLYAYVLKEIAEGNEELKELQNKEDPTQDDELRMKSLRKKITERKKLLNALAKKTGRRFRVVRRKIKKMRRIPRRKSRVTAEESAKVDDIKEDDLDSMPREKLKKLFHYVDEEIDEGERELDELMKKTNPTRSDISRMIKLRKRLLKRKVLRNTIIKKSRRKIRRIRRRVKRPHKKLVKVTPEESAIVDEIKEEDLKSMPKEKLKRLSFYVDEEMIEGKKELDELEKKEDPTPKDIARKLELKKKLKKRKKLKEAMAEQVPEMLVKLTPEESAKVDAIEEEDLKSMPKEKLKHLSFYADEEIAEGQRELDELEKKTNPTREDEFRKLALKKKIMKRRRLRNALARNFGQISTTLKPASLLPVKLTPEESAKVDEIKEEDLKSMPKEKLKQLSSYVDEEIVEGKKELDKLEEKTNPTREDEFRKLALKKKIMKRRRLKNVLAQNIGQSSTTIKPASLLPVKLTPEKSNEVDAIEEIDLDRMPKEKLDDLYRYVDEELTKLNKDLNQLDHKKPLTQEDLANKEKLRDKIRNRKRLLNSLAKKTGHQLHESKQPVKVTPADSRVIDALKKDDLPDLPNKKLDNLYDYVDEEIHGMEKELVPLMKKDQPSPEQKARKEELKKKLDQRKDLRKTLTAELNRRHMITTTMRPVDKAEKEKKTKQEKQREVNLDQVKPEQIAKMTKPNQEKIINDVAQSVNYLTDQMNKIPKENPSKNDKKTASILRDELDLRAEQIKVLEKVENVQKPELLLPKKKSNESKTLLKVPATRVDFLTKQEQAVVLDSIIKDVKNNIITQLSQVKAAIPTQNSESAKQLLEAEKRILENKLSDRKDQMQALEKANPTIGKKLEKMPKKVKRHPELKEKVDSHSLEDLVKLAPEDQSDLYEYVVDDIGELVEQVQWLEDKLEKEEGDPVLESKLIMLKDTLAKRAKQLDALKKVVGLKPIEEKPSTPEEQQLLESLGEVPVKDLAKVPANKKSKLLKVVAKDIENLGSMVSKIDSQLLSATKQQKPVLMAQKALLASKMEERGKQLKALEGNKKPVPKQLVQSQTTVTPESKLKAKLLDRMVPEMIGKLPKDKQEEMYEVLVEEIPKKIQEISWLDSQLEERPNDPSLQARKVLLDKKLQNLEEKMKVIEKETGKKDMLIKRNPTAEKKLEELDTITPKELSKLPEKQVTEYLDVINEELPTLVKELGLLETEQETTKDPKKKAVLNAKEKLVRHAIEKRAKQLENIKKETGMGTPIDILPGLTTAEKRKIKEYDALNMQELPLLKKPQAQEMLNLVIAAIPDLVAQKERVDKVLSEVGQKGQKSLLAKKALLDFKLEKRVKQLDTLKKILGMKKPESGKKLSPKSVPTNLSILPEAKKKVLKETIKKDLNLLKSQLRELKDKKDKLSKVKSILARHQLKNRENQFRALEGKKAGHTTNEKRGFSLKDFSVERLDAMSLNQLEKTKLAIQRLAIRVGDNILNLKQMKKKTDKAKKLEAEVKEALRRIEDRIEFKESPAMKHSILDKIQDNNLSKESKGKLKAIKKLAQKDINYANKKDEEITRSLKKEKQKPDPAQESWLTAIKKLKEKREKLLKKVEKELKKKGKIETPKEKLVALKKETVSGLRLLRKAAKEEAVAAKKKIEELKKLPKSDKNDKKIARMEATAKKNTLKAQILKEEIKAKKKLEQRQTTTRTPIKEMKKQLVTPIPMLLPTSDTIRPLDPKLAKIDLNNLEGKNLDQLKEIKKNLNTDLLKLNREIDLLKIMEKSPGKKAETLQQLAQAREKEIGKVIAKISKRAAKIKVEKHARKAAKHEKQAVEDKKNANEEKLRDVAAQKKDLERMPNKNKSKAQLVDLNKKEKYLREKQKKLEEEARKADIKLKNIESKLAASRMGKHSQEFVKKKSKDLLLEVKKAYKQLKKLREEQEEKTEKLVAARIAKVPKPIEILTLKNALKDDKKQIQEVEDEIETLIEKGEEKFTKSDANAAIQQPKDHLEIIKNNAKRAENKLKNLEKVKKPTPAEKEVGKIHEMNEKDMKDAQMKHEEHIKSLDKVAKESGKDRLNELLNKSTKPVLTGERANVRQLQRLAAEKKKLQEKLEKKISELQSMTPKERLNNKSLVEDMEKTLKELEEIGKKESKVLAGQVDKMTSRELKKQIRKIEKEEEETRRKLRSENLKILAGANGGITLLRDVYKKQLKLLEENGKLVGGVESKKNGISKDALVDLEKTLLRRKELERKGESAGNKITKHTTTVTPKANMAKLAEVAAEKRKLQRKVDQLSKKVNAMTPEEKAKNKHI
ncbi:hypothetical protein Ciccas_008392, partial [Cichlidogyrus casuarinus]